MKLHDRMGRGYLYLLPAGILFVLIEIVPIGYAIWMSFHKKLEFSPEMKWNGLENYFFILQSDEFWGSLFKGGIFAGASVALQLILGLLLALILHQSFAGRGLFRSLVLLAYFIPTIATALIWQWICDPSYGILNRLLVNFSLTSTAINFFSNPQWAMLMVILVNAWNYTPFVIIVLLARLQTIPTSFYEVAKIEGASSWRRFFDITLPHLRSAILLVVLLRGIWMFNKFDLIWLLTSGGPAGKTTTLPILAYFVTFRQSNYGQGAALSVVMFLILIIFAFVYFRYFKPEKEIEVE